MEKEIKTKDENGYFILPKNFQKSGHKFAQKWRDGDYAIYERIMLSCGSITYEAIKVLKHDARDMFWGKMEASETYPSDAQFGKLGFCCASFERAEERIQQMKKADLENLAKKQKRLRS